MLEGSKIISEARRSGATVDTVFVDVAAARADELAVAEACAAEIGARVVEVQPGVLTRALDTVTPQPIAATVGRVDVPLSTVAHSKLSVVLVGVSDPGNAGTLVRSAAAAGADLVVVTRGSVDAYNPKVVRASAGAIFQLRLVVDAALEAALAHLGNLGVKRWGTAARGDSDYSDADLSVPSAIVLGNESRGLPERIPGGVDGWIAIPMSGQVESLNVGVAGSILLFEAARQQRRAQRDGEKAGAPNDHRGAA